jgi:hypothetical protein
MAVRETGPSFLVAGLLSPNSAPPFPLIPGSHGGEAPAPSASEPRRRRAPPRREKQGGGRFQLRSGGGVCARCSRRVDLRRRLAMEVPVARARWRRRLEWRQFELNGGGGHGGVPRSSLCPLSSRRRVRAAEPAPPSPPWPSPLSPSCCRRGPMTRTLAPRHSGISDGRYLRQFSCKQDEHERQQESSRTPLQGFFLLERGTGTG